MTARKYDLHKFATRLKKMMKAKGVTQEQLAELVGCSRKTISQYCNEKSIPDDTNRKALANYFDVSVEYLLGEDEYPNIYAKFDEKLGEEGLKELQFQVKLYEWFEREFNFSFDDYTPSEINKFESEIREFIQFKVSQLRKDDEQ